MPITDRLAEQNNEDLISQKRPREEIVIGAPHHAPAGIEKLPASRPADENTGFLTFEVAKSLNCPFVIAVNAERDPNKRLDTEYSKAVAQLAPKYLVEVHGHGKGKAKANIEISAGSQERNHHSKLLACLLRDAFKEHTELNELDICGNFHEIYFKATKSPTIQHHKWIGIHIELPPSLRKANDSVELPEVGQQFCSCLAAALNKTVSS